MKIGKFNKTTTNWNPIFDDRPTSNVPRIKFSYTFSKDHIVKGNHVLDIGCGTGSYTNLIDSKHCIGIDLDIQALKIAKRYCMSSEFVVCSALNLPFRNQTFDVICMWGVFEEIPPRAEVQAIIEVRSMLVPNATFLLSAYNDHIISKLMDPAFIFRGVRHYNARKFLKLICELGFNIDKYTIRGRFYTLVSIFLFYFYKHILHKKDGKLKTFFDRKSENEIFFNDKGVVYLFVAARKRNN